MSHLIKLPYYSLNEFSKKEISKGNASEVFFASDALSKRTKAPEVTTEPDNGRIIPQVLLKMYPELESTESWLNLSIEKEDYENGDDTDISISDYLEVEYSNDEESLRNMESDTSDSSSSCSTCNSSSDSSISMYQVPCLKSIENTDLRQKPARVKKQTTESVKPTKIICEMHGIRTISYNCDPRYIETKPNLLPNMTQSNLSDTSVETTCHQDTESIAEQRVYSEYPKLLLSESSSESC